MHININRFSVDSFNLIMNKFLLLNLFIQIVFQLIQCQKINSSINPLTNLTINSPSNFIKNEILPQFNQSCVDDSQCFGQSKCQHNICQNQHYKWLESTDDQNSNLSPSDKLFYYILFVLLALFIMILILNCCQYISHI